MLLNDLSHLGLSEKQSLVYLALLERGDAKASDISRATGLQRPTVYDLLEQLRTEGYASIYEKRGIKRYIPANPDTFDLKLKEKSDIYQRILPELLSRVPKSDSRPMVRFYEGLGGVKTVFEETLLAQNKQLLGILSMKDLYEIPGRTYMDEYVRRRILLGHSLRVLRSRPKDIEETWKSDVLERRELRYTPVDMIFDMTTYIFDNKVGLISTQKENYGMIIESKEYSALMRNLFESLWIISELAKK